MHMLKKVTIVSNELKWLQNLASLIASNIIVSYGEFPNVPLLGTKGCINYNHVLSLRKHDYPMNGHLDAKALELFILHDIEASNPTMRKVIRVW